MGTAAVGLYLYFPPTEIGNLTDEVESIEITQTELFIIVSKG